MRTLIDANVILRYVLNDIPEMAKKSAEIVRNGAFTTPEILAEVSYVLRKVYQMTREQSAETIKAVLNDVHTDEKEILRYAMDLYASSSLDFVDCVIVARHNIADIPVFSFDKKLNHRLVNNY